MSKPVPVLVNAAGGAAAARGDKLGDEVKAAFAAAGLAIDLQLLEGKAMAKAAATLAEEPLVVVGGGDGTLGCVAQALVDNGKAALGILPLGTRNHLARELGVPLDLPGAAKLIAARTTRRIDLARVNDHLFVNNASVGLYPLMVRERERSDLPKWLAKLPAAREALRRLPHHRLSICMPDATREVRTPMLFVGNNRYELDMGKVGQRAALDGGELSVFAVAARSRLSLIGFALRALLGAADAKTDFAAIGAAPEFTVEGHAKTIDIALDGEVMKLEMPLKFAIQPKALDVITPVN